MFRFVRGAIADIVRRTPLAGIALLALSINATGCAFDSRASRQAERQPITVVAENASPRILCIVAHPDDEISFAGTIYKASTLLGAACDVLTITNGEAGYKYSTLAERLYGLELTDPDVGRKYLPEIRRHELMTGLSYLAARDLYLLNERDDGYSKDRAHVLDPATSPWDLERVRHCIDEVLARGRYDFVFTHLPSEETHGHHQCATLLALEAVARVPAEYRPVILGTRHVTKTDEPKKPYTGLAGENSTLPKADAPSFTFDRTEPFGFDGKLNYKAVVNWAIAAHKSQGTMQLGMNRGDIEEYWLYAIDDETSIARARDLFERLKAPQFVPKEYPASAPTH